MRREFGVACGCFVLAAGCAVLLARGLGWL